MTIIDRLVASPPPLSVDGAGVIRVGGTRVRLETVIHAFNAGLSAEEVVLKYPSLDLTDVYAAITYYLWHRTEVDHYLTDRETSIAEGRLEDEVKFASKGVRERLLARRGTQP